MWVEWSVDEDFAIPPATKGLSKEVKVVKGWLGASELFGAPQMLVEEPLPVAAPLDIAPSVAELVEELVVEEEAVGVDNVIVSCPFFYLRSDLADTVVE
jgi:hypothetical protein